MSTKEPAATTQRNVRRLEEGRSRGIAQTLFEKYEIPFPGDRVRLQGLDGLSGKEGVVENMTHDGMVHVKFDENIAPGRRHAKVHFVEFELIERVPRPDPEEAREDVKEGAMKDAPSEIAAEGAEVVADAAAAQVKDITERKRR